jgi:hypothetical protein
MDFDIRQHVFDATTGEYLEDVALAYQEELLARFEASPEGQAYHNAGHEFGWSNPFLHYGITYLSVTPPDMTPAHLQEILFDLFPKKVSVPADAAPDIVHELRAFWSFLQREFSLKNAAACLKILDEKAAQKLEAAMDNPANFGMAKSFMMMGQKRGFDMTSEAGVQQWMETYNAELAAGTGQPLPLSQAMPGSPASRSKKTQSKNKRKMQRNSRKTNRKKR